MLISLIQELISIVLDRVLAFFVVHIELRVSVLRRHLISAAYTM